jgi:hypothetical protein
MEVTMQQALTQNPEAKNDNIVRGRFASNVHSDACILPKKSPRDRMTFAEVAIALALDGYTRNAIIIQKLRVLANPKYAHAMPLPINPRIVGGRLKSGPDAICAASIWSRRQFEYWRNGNSPDGGPNAVGCGLDAQTSARLLAEGAARLAGGGA